MSTHTKHRNTVIIRSNLYIGYDNEHRDEINHMTLTLKMNFALDIFQPSRMLSSSSA